MERELQSPPALEGQVLTTGPPGKSQKGVLSNYFEKVVSHELFSYRSATSSSPIFIFNCNPIGGLDKDTFDGWMEGLASEGENWLKQKA